MRILTVNCDAALANRERRIDLCRPKDVCRQADEQVFLIRS